MKKVTLLLLSILAGCLLFSGCKNPDADYHVPEYPIEKEEETENNPAMEVQETELPKEEEIFLWLAYWNYAGYEKEMTCLGKDNKAVSVFGVLFDAAQDAPFMTPETEELLKKVMSSKKEDEKIYLSFINDLRLFDGSYSNKDPELLARLFLQEEDRKQHVQEIVDLALSSKVDGVEIDYENLKKNEALWEPFCLFLTLLKEKCDEQGLLLRVVLGAYDVDKAAFPKGIEYAVMCYNLYGTHSGPGPKADVAFLKETFQRCQNLQGDVSAAFSSGGFIWADGKCEKAVTEKEAVELYASLGEGASSLIRDSASGALSFTYEKDGVVREVWYADGETLSLWKDTARECGITKFSLWKAGGNVERSLLHFAG